MAVSELPGNPNAVWTVKTNTAGLTSELHDCVCGCGDGGMGCGWVWGCGDGGCVDVCVGVGVS